MRLKVTHSFEVTEKTEMETPVLNSDDQIFEEVTVDISYVQPVIVYYETDLDMSLETNRDIVASQTFDQITKKFPNSKYNLDRHWNFEYEVVNEPVTIA